MKFFYTLLSFVLFSSITAQSGFVSSGIKLMPVKEIPNIYADARQELTEMVVNESITLTANHRANNKHMLIDSGASHNRTIQSRKKQTFPKL